jgi:hypothetical protein
MCTYSCAAATWLGSSPKENNILLMWSRVSEEGKAKATQKGLGGHTNHYMLQKRILFGVLCERVLNFSNLKKKKLELLEMCPTTN